MTYTGGTTGRPKGVLCNHRARALTAHTVAFEEALDERDVVAIVTPLFHVAALNIMFQPAILVGATCTFVTPWSAEKFMAPAARDKVTAAFMVPTQANQLVSHPQFDAGKLASWRKLSFAGAPMPDWVQVELKKKLPDLLLTQIYGQSEMGVLTSLRDWYLPAKLGSVGRQVFNVDVALFSAQGDRVGPGVLGEIGSRGDNLMMEYYNEPEQTAAFFKHGDGWGLTGDVGIMDSDGFITLVDRAKDMLISGGENVYPKEIEDVLYQLDAVSECAVFGIPDDKWGELPAAYIQLKTGARAWRRRGDRALHAPSGGIQATTGGEIRDRVSEDAHRQDPEEPAQGTLLERPREAHMSTGLELGIAGETALVLGGTGAFARRLRAAAIQAGARAPSCQQPLRKTRNGENAAHPCRFWWRVSSAIPPSGSASARLPSRMDLYPSSSPMRAGRRPASSRKSPPNNGARHSRPISSASSRSPAPCSRE